MSVFRENKWSKQLGDLDGRDLGVECLVMVKAQELQCLCNWLIDGKFDLVDKIFN